MSLSLVTKASAPPLELDLVKLQCRLTSSDTDQDDLLVLAMETAAGEFEDATGRALMTQTWKELLDGFPCERYLEIPKPPLVSVTHVKYRDSAGDLQTWDSSNYVVEAPAGPKCARGRLSLAYGVSWPSTYGQAGDVEIQFVCGYGAASESIPAQVRTAMLQRVATFYLYREAIVAGTVNELPGSVPSVYRRYVSRQTQTRRQMRVA